MGSNKLKKMINNDYFLMIDSHVVVVLNNNDIVAGILVFYSFVVDI
jgi:small nuclear ribonucleoprotein (snRNP)-like protein